jgi:subtilisin-like proprotein convertase family protein
MMKRSLGSLVAVNRRELLSFLVVLSFGLSVIISPPAAAQKRGSDLRAEEKGKEVLTVGDPEPSYINRTAAPEVSGNEFEPNGTAATANPMPAFDPMSIMRGAISPAADIDFFSFSAPAGSRVWIHTDSGGTQNPGANSRDTLIDLIAPDGTTVIETDDDDGICNGGDGTIESGLCSVIAGRTLVAGGTYFVRVRAFSATGVIDPYRVFVQVTTANAVAETEANNTIGTANTGGLRSGVIGAAADVDYYSIVAQAGSVIHINADADPERDGTGTDLLLTLRDASDAVLLTIDSSVVGSLANPAAEGSNFTVTTPGTYYVRVQDFDPAASGGTYHLLLARTTVAQGSGCIPTGTSFTNNTPVNIPSSGTPVVTSSINVSGAGTSLAYIRLTTNLTHTFAGDLDMTLTSPAGTVVTLGTDNGGANVNVYNGTVWYDFANPFGQVPYAFNPGLVNDHQYTTNVVASPLVPEEGFDAFRGENPNGTWTLTISDDANLDGGDLSSWTLEVFTVSAPQTSGPFVFSNSTPVVIGAGAPPTVVTSTINVSGLAGPIEDLDVFTSLSHTFPSDLDITLQAPSGKIVTLSTDNGAGNDNVFAGTLWDSDANPGGQVPYTTNAGMVTDHPYVNGVVATPLTPEESLGAFRGESPNGVWRITISDDADGDGGQLTSWDLRFTVNTSCPLPTAAGAEIGGRVMTADGYGLRNARVTLTNQAGEIVQSAVTGAFGFYRFSNVEVGQTYIVAVGSKRYFFTPRVIQVSDNLTELDFTALP